MSNTKQVIIMRTDLQMRKGKMIAQGAHASMSVLLQVLVTRNFGYHERVLQPTSAMMDWLDGLFTKVCVRVDSLEELQDIYNKAFEARLPCALIEDSGATEFHGKPTITCCAIGPEFNERVNAITGHLKLL